MYKPEPNSEPYNPADELSDEDLLIAQARSEDSEDEANERADELEANQLGVGPQNQKEGLYKLLEKFWKSTDNKKLGNVDSKSLGNSIVAVRPGLFLSQCGQLTGHTGWSNFWNTNVEDTLKTSASSRGWFTDLSVSVKKSNERRLKSYANTIPQSAKWGGGLWGKKPESPQGGMNNDS